MAVTEGLGNGAKTALGAAAAVVVAIGGWLIFDTAPVPAPEPAPEAVPAAAPAAPQAAAAPEAAPAAPEAVAAPAAPSFDVVRVAPDGAATVAGRAEPGADVSLRLDGVEVAQAQADGTGRFAALFTLPPSDAPRLLSLVMLLAGAEVPGTETVAIAPVQAPVEAPVVAGVTPEVAPEAPAALIVSDAGAQVVQPGADVAPELAANVTIDTIAYTPEGAVQVGGKGTADQTLRLYLDGAPLIEAKIAPSGAWNVTLPSVPPGIYTLRADQIAADGKVTSRFETPFKREAPEALAAAAGAPAAPAPAPSAAMPQPEAVAALPAAPASPAAPAGDPAANPGAPVAPVVGEAPVPATPGADAVPAPVAADGAQPAAAPAQEQAAGQAPDAAPAVSAPPPPVTVTVQPGFTLWAIAEERFGDGLLYVQVFEANKSQIRDPDLIYPGQVFTLPGAP